MLVPEHESQWPYVRVRLEQVVEAFCPNLLSMETASELFRRFDYDKNNALDYKELQHFNAYVFKHFPRATDSPPIEAEKDKSSSSGRLKTSESIDADDEVELNLEFCGLPSKMFFTCHNLTYLDLSFQVSNFFKTFQLNPIKNQLF